MHSIEYDPIHDEMSVPVPFGAAILTFRGGANGEEPPIRVIQGSQTRLEAPDRMGIDPANNEIFVPEGKKVLIFPREANGNVAPIRALADPIINTSKFNVHELRETIHRAFGEKSGSPKILIQVNSFGYRHGVPADSDLVFDVRFLPNPNYIPEFKQLNGRNTGVARYIRSFPQTEEFVKRTTELLVYLLPHYIREGKSYLTVSFGCTGGHHRSVFIAAEIRKRLARVGYTVSSSDRDLRHPV